MTNWVRRIAISAMVMGLAGCQNDGSPGAKTQTQGSSNARADSSSATHAQATPVQPVSVHSTPKDPPQTTTPPKDDVESDAAKRAKAENMIYATIRIKMEEMIEQRAKLLKSGKNPSDVEIRQLEGSIMRARELLEENGEIVEPVDPPIIQTVPKQ